MLKKLMYNKQFLLLLIIINISSFFYGLFLYSRTLPNFPLYQWIFVMVSPFYIALMTVNLILLYFKRKINKVFAMFSFLGVMSLGISSLFFYPIFIYTSSYPFSTFILIILWFGHVSLGLESLLLLGYLKKLSIYQYSLILIWYIISIYFSVVQNTFIYFSYGFPYKWSIAIFYFITIIILIIYTSKKRVSQ